MAAKLRQQVQEFNKLFGLRVRSSPGVPPDEVIRLHLGMCVEEMLELVEACGVQQVFIDDMKRAFEAGWKAPRKAVDLPAATDALGDSDYVNESFRDALGIDGEPIADEIHRANMGKAHTCQECLGLGGALGLFECAFCKGTGLVVVKNAAGKVQKPAGWKPPDIDAELKKQGWNPGG
jgi:predicted HAD superfamily Cof-like phosphohydrolase